MFSTTKEFSSQYYDPNQQDAFASLSCINDLNNSTKTIFSNYPAFTSNFSSNYVQEQELTNLNDL